MKWGKKGKRQPEKCEQIYILCLAGRTWITGTPRSFRRWRQSLVWDDAAWSTKESLEKTWHSNDIPSVTIDYKRIVVTLSSVTSGTSQPVLVVVNLCRCTCACVVEGAPTSCLSSLLKLQEKQELRSAWVAVTIQVCVSIISHWPIKFPFTSLFLDISFNQHMQVHMSIWGRSSD